MAIFLNPACGACDCTGTAATRIGRVYVVGLFTSIGGAANNYCAMLDSDGHAVSTFVCSLNAVAYCCALDETNGILWIGGEFTTVNGTACKGLAGVDWDTGALVYNPAMTGRSSGLGSDPYVVHLTTDATNDHLYVSGNFRQIGGVNRAHLARFTLSTGAWDTTWVPVIPNGAEAYATRILDPYAYICGGFTTMNGTARSGVARVDRALGSTTDAWYPVPTGGGPNDFLPVSASSIFLAGNFTSINATTRRGLCEVDGSGVLTSWDPGNPILGPAGSAGIRLATYDALTFLVCGDFTSAGGVTATYHTAKFLYAGSVDSGFSGANVGATQANQIALGPDNRVYACGQGVGHDIAAMDPTTGAIKTDWLPAANSTCYDFALTLTAA